VDGPQESAHFGISVNGAGDVNGDGYDDVIFGANLYDETFTDVGKVWVYNGSATGLSDTPAWTIVGLQEDQRLGLRVDSAGDVNADGYSDVFVGSHRYDGPEPEEGRGWVFLGGPGGLEDTPNATLEIDVVGAKFGASGGRVGDVNGDGYDDVAVGAAGYANGQDAEGGAFLYYGSASGVQTPHVWSFETDQEETYLGEGDSVDGVGDINGDGFDDLVLGAYAYDETRTDEGRAYVFYGSASGLSLVPDWVLSSRHSDARLGYSPTNAGDTNGDGIPDFLTDAHGHDENETDEGRVLVFYGPLPEDTDCPR
jgi:hypothetical protein